MVKNCIYIIFLFTAVIGWSQSDAQKKLEVRKEKLLKEIQMHERMLNDKTKKEKTAQNLIVLQKSKIEARVKLIDINEKQATILKNNIYTNQLRINKLNKDLKTLKEDYAKMIVKSYKSKSEQSRAMFILSSESFTQAYKRIQYMKQYASYRKVQGVEIEEKNIELKTKNEKINQQKKEKESLIAEQEKAKSLLERERKEQVVLVNAIKKDQKRIVADIKKRQQETKSIDQKINKLIKEAIAEANKKAEKTNASKVASKSNTTTKTTPKSSSSSLNSGSSSKIILTEETKLVSNSFKANKGRLPSPVEKGFVSLKFGNQPHPIQPSLTIHSNGIEITTEKGSVARSVFEGEVMAIQVYSPINIAVFVQHGDFITVYQNLIAVTVSKGDKIAHKQVIGRIHHNNATDKTAIKFSVLQNDKFLNPQSWLYSF